MLTAELSSPPDRPLAVVGCILRGGGSRSRQNSPRTVSSQRYRVESEFPFSTLTTLRSIYLTGTECNCRSALRRSVSPRSAQAACFGSPETPTARAYFTSRPPVFTSRCCKLVSDHFSILLAAPGWRGSKSAISTASAWSSISVAARAVKIAMSCSALFSPPSLTPALEPAQAESVAVPRRPWAYRRAAHPQQDRLARLLLGGTAFGPQGKRPPPHATPLFRHPSPRGRYRPAHHPALVRSP